MRMKKGIHPEYRPVIFRDRSADFAILSRSTIETERTIEWEDGNTYPLVELDISSASHPFYTGRQRIVDTGGRVQRFENRRQARQNRQ
jgi:large subunit ribosomal protein L31